MKYSVKSSNLIYPELSFSIVGSAIDVHNQQGPGWDEWDYHRSMIESLASKGHRVVSHERKTLLHRGRVADQFELDLLVDDLILLELKHIRSDFHPVHYTQLINYLKRWDKRLGILVNYGLERLNYRRIPFDVSPWSIAQVGKWSELESRYPDPCKKLLLALQSVFEQHGFGYGVTVCRKILMIELEYLGAQAVFPVCSPRYGAVDLGERSVDAILMDSRMLVSFSASGCGASSTDLAYLKCYMRQMGIPCGVLVDVGSPCVKLKGVL